MIYPEIVISSAEQEYLKQICLHTLDRVKNIQTKELAELVKTKPSSVTDMVRKLAAKELVIYDKHHGCRLSERGLREALQIIRRNRLWELFLFEKLEMDWKEIDHVASKLQSLTTEGLAEKLSIFLGHPTYDPHGEAIPGQKGIIPMDDFPEIYDLKILQRAEVFGFRDTSSKFLEYIEKLNLMIGTSIKVIGMIAYNNSVEIMANNQQTFILSKETAQKIYVKINDMQ